ncbi:GntR family transcriptional regulator [Streptomyces sp. NPDC059009]|uniref:GntR family transcriptional regulator n=1 Tax=Streptomyces sp. NPDC059009 TaxID=3346694 RepID=UPI0036A14DD1
MAAHTHAAPPYQSMAEDLVHRLVQHPETATTRLLDAEAVARHYHVSATTAEFVRRAARTRLRLQHAPACEAAGPTEQEAAFAAADTSPAAFRQVAQDLLVRINSGELTGMLPSQVQLATHYRVSRFTIKRAVGVLTQQRVVKCHGSAGTRILAPGPSARTDEAG